MDIVADLLGMRLEDLRASGKFDSTMLSPEEIGDRRYVSALRQGVSLVLGECEEVVAVQLHAEGHEGFTQFQSELPRDLQFAMSRDEVRDLLGSPGRSGDKQVLPVLGVVPAWDSYVVEDCQLHIEYDHDEHSIRLVSVTA